MRIDLGRTAIIVSICKTTFVIGRDGWGISASTSPRRPRADPPLAAGCRRCAPPELPVIWLNWGNRPDRLNLSPALLHVYKPEGNGSGRRPAARRRGAGAGEDGWWAAAVDELPVAAADIKVSKYRMSGFWDTPLDRILRNLGVTTLLFAGVNLDQCVLCTLQDANFLGYDCLLVADCAATTSPPFASRRRSTTSINVSAS